jgi:glutamine---fructose-6-phosphate transaminase (isomerizing)
LRLSQRAAAARGLRSYPPPRTSHGVARRQAIRYDPPCRGGTYKRGRKEPKGGCSNQRGQRETADTLATLRHAKAHGQHVLSIVNVATSTIRDSDVVMPTLAGPEVGIASTKAFTCQLAVLACLAIAAGRARGVLSEEDEHKLVRALIEVPRHMTEALALEPEIERLARDIAKNRDVLYLGRGTSYPLALEGALKLKEISYIHAEGYAGGELKHGPIALIDETIPVIVIAPYDGVFEKTRTALRSAIA